MIEKTADWLVYLHLTGPICARAGNPYVLYELDLGGIMIGRLGRLPGNMA